MDITADGIEGFIRSKYNELKADLKKVVPGAYSITAPASDPTPAVTDSAPVATADPVSITTVSADGQAIGEIPAGQTSPATNQAPVADTAPASGAAAPAVGPDVQTQLSLAMVKVNAAQAEYNQLVQQVAGGQQAAVQG